jgi:hypothetical protein
MYEGVHVELHVFLITALDGGEQSASCARCFTPTENAPGTHWIGDWVGSRASLDMVAKKKHLPLSGVIIPSSPAHSPLITLTELFQLLEISYYWLFLFEKYIKLDLGRTTS